MALKIKNTLFGDSLTGKEKLEFLKKQKLKHQKNRLVSESLDAYKKNWLQADSEEDRERWYKQNEEHLTELYEILIQEEELNDTNAPADIQIGRPEDFPKENTKKWHNELKEQEEYQHGNGKPFLKKIRRRIRELHKKDTGYLPSLDTIKDHYRKLGLTRNS